MELKMRESGLCCYDPTNKSVVLINTVSKNNQVFSKRQINGAEQAKPLHKKLGYASVKYFSWIFQIQQIIDCSLTVQDIDIAQTIWGKNIAALKVNTTRNKPIHVAGYIVRIPKELVNIHKEVFMTADIFFVNGIPFLFF